jgi:hypothetical protein
MKPLALVKESRPKPLKLPMPSENDDSDDDGREGLGDVIESGRRASSRSSGGREGVRDSPVDGELVVVEEEDVPEGIEGSGGDDGVTEDDDEEGGEEVEELEEDDAEEEGRGTTADWRRGEDALEEADETEGGVEGRSPDDALSAIRRCLWGLSVIEVNMLDGSLPKMLGLHMCANATALSHHQHDEFRKDDATAKSVPELLI